MQTAVERAISLKQALVDFVYNESRTSRSSIVIELQNSLHPISSVL
jgi:hypothetical protein